MKMFNWYVVTVDRHQQLSGFIIPSGKRLHSSDIMKVKKLAKDAGFMPPITLTNFQRLERLDNDSNQS